MQVTVHGINYNGSHALCEHDTCDARNVIVHLTGTSEQLARYILLNFAPDVDQSDVPEWSTIEGVVAEMKDDPLAFQPEYGGIYKLSGDVEVDVTDDCPYIFTTDTGDFDEVTEDQCGFIDLGTVDLATLDAAKYEDHVNELVRTMHQTVGLPPRVS